MVDLGARSLARTVAGQRAASSRRRWAAILLLGSLAGCATAETAAVPKAPALERPRVVKMPELPPGIRLVGLDSAGLTGLLGSPTLIRSEFQSQYWRYDLGGCQLDLFLYHDSATGGHRVVYLDARPSGYQAPARAEVCTALAERLQGPAAADESAAKGGDLPAVEAH